LFFLFIYINDLPGSINNLSKPTLFTDDTNIIFTHPNLSEFKVNSNIVFEKITNWFQINLLSQIYAKPITCTLCKKLAIQST